jgi:hypothetical protein
MKVFLKRNITILSYLFRGNGKPVSIQELQPREFLFIDLISFANAVYIKFGTVNC